MTMHSVPSEGRARPLDWLVTPALAFTHPNDVLADADLTDAERKAILASWASHARAVENMPWLRRLENGSTVPVSEVLAALRALDRGMQDKPIRPVPPARGGRLAGILRPRPGLSINVDTFWHIPIVDSRELAMRVVYSAGQASAPAQP